MSRFPVSENGNFSGVKEYGDFCVFAPIDDIHPEMRNEVRARPGRVNGNMNGVQSITYFFKGTKLCIGHNHFAIAAAVLADAQGRVVSRGSIASKYSAMLPVAHLTPGVYMLMVTQKYLHHAIAVVVP
ncbi:MAG: hypothetical protein GF398_16915 [Chitinivibrionales bacterium]|nr:hypothetical protein [Chitinivibrionales bacterium]